MALRLHALVYSEGHADGVTSTTTLVPFRDLAAVVDDVPYELALPDEAMLRAHHAIVEAAVRRGGAVPAPPGTVFRSRESLEQWMELHYVAITDALAYVDDRLGARVYVRHAEQATRTSEEREAGSDLAAAAAECFRILRREAVASVALRTEHATGIAVAAGFLVERELWQDFVGEVEAEQRRRAELSIELTGPWPPYDFVRMQFGG